MRAQLKCCPFPVNLMNTAGSHGWKNGSLYFCRYQADNAFNEEEDSEFSSDEDEEFLPIDTIENGKREAKVEKAKPINGKANAKPKVTLVDPNKDDESNSDDLEEYEVT